MAQTDIIKRGDMPEQSAALALLRAMAHLAQASFTNPTLLGANLKQVRRAMTRLETLLMEEDF